uniref:hypothetical protein n=1 Tax=Yersinia aleksiciae TaxID=263819 RepID=UPI001C974FCD
DTKLAIDKLSEILKYFQLKNFYLYGNYLSIELPNSSLGQHPLASLIKTSISIGLGLPVK